MRRMWSRGNFLEGGRRGGGELEKN